MEASMHAVRVPDAERVILSQGTPTMGVFAWLGWAVALTFLLVLLFFHVRLKRRERSLLRGAEDLLLLPSPSRRHRSR